MSSASIQRVTVIGTGLIGSSVALALRAQGFAGHISGWDQNPAEAATAQRRGALDAVASAPLEAARSSDLVLLATPVFGILDWLDKLAAVARPGQLLTDVGSTKRLICERAAQLYNHAGTAEFLAGHPMAGKEVFGAAEADGQLFQGAVWLFADGDPRPPSRLNAEWRAWVQRFGARIVDVDPVRHDDLCAWASHLPQMLGTALAALLEDNFGGSAELQRELRDVGGRAMREMTRLGASPYSMWRDIAHTNTGPIAATLEALEQRLAHLRLHLTQPELREEFERGNQFRRNF